ncbi:tRNA lysidine(34) synthetase TilS [Flavobacterium sp. MFBS3-15]|uniref:tRNA lysidine(34) synthetase TilS n=1 Tax=Flavobacterium sp. MFBS3-15 TaxID=2989816 RepID=UPI002235C0A4|nr:tRNA lysidine(34) synthetase TilS [Flavobacterium sp. MFBS3-15]MCW4467917.1 tRNA lysidine(34) synthetase TilS [Flavobacterium sp. MFBS3-15]
MLSKLQDHLSKNLPFLKDSKLLVAVSGGLDSMVLVHLLQQLNYNISIAHCNFNLRGNESDGDEESITQYAKENSFNFFVTRFDTKSFASDNKLSIQVAARQLRYLWFDELLRENNLDYLLTAHHLDDSIETFLINLTRGTGLDGLKGIPQQNGNIVRPLLPFTRDEILAYAKENNIQWREDSSNASDKYLRNKLRHDVVPLLKELNSGFADSFRQTLEYLQQAQSLVEDASVLIYKQVVSEKENQKHFDIVQLKRLPNYRAYLYQWLSPFGFTAWDDIYALADAQSGKYILSQNFRLLKDRAVLILEPLSQEKDKVFEIAESQHKIDDPISLTFSRTHAINENTTKKTVFVDNQLIKFPLILRKWSDGDYFCPTGMNGQRKKISKFFKDEKFNLSEKENTWLLCSGEDILWVVGHRADDRFKATKTTNIILKIEVL